MADKFITELFKNPFCWYLALWCLYILQGVLYPSAGPISASILAIILIWSYRHFLLVFKWKNKPFYFKGLELLFIMHFIYGIIHFMTDGSETKGMVMTIPTFYYLKSYSMSLLPIMSCYYFISSGKLSNKIINIWIVVFLTVAILEYHHQYVSRISAAAILTDEVTNNAGYTILSLIPCMLLIKKNYLQYLAIVICVLLVLFSMKRGAVLIMIIVLFLYVIQKFKEQPGYKKFVFLSIIFLIGCGVFLYLEDTLFQSDYFMGRVNQTLKGFEGGSSGRDEIAQNLIDNYMNNANVFQQLFGIGADGTLKIGSNYAHSDWVETLTNQGILGICVNTFYWFCLLRMIFIKTTPQPYRNILQLVFTITFFSSIFSMSITDNSIYTCFILSLSLFESHKHKVQSKISLYEQNYNSNTFVKGE